MADSTPKLAAQLPMSPHDLAKHLLATIQTVATMVNDMNVRLARMEERQTNVVRIADDHSALEIRVGKLEILQAKTGTTVTFYAAAVAGVSAIVVSGIIGLAFASLHH